MEIPTAFYPANLRHKTPDAGIYGNQIHTEFGKVECEGNSIMRALIGLSALIGFPLGFCGGYLVLVEGKIVAGVLIGLGGLMILAVGSKLIDMDR